MSNIIRLDKTGHISIDGQRIGRDASVSSTAILIIDRSGSMAGPKSSFASSGAWDFSQSALNKGYRIATIDFATTASMTCSPSLNPDDIRRGCFADSVTGSTGMHEALELVMSLTPSAGDTIVVVTDGAVDNPPQTLALGTRLKEMGVQILAIGTDDADKTFLSQLASRPDLGMMVASRSLRQAITDASRLLATPRKP